MARPVTNHFELDLEMTSRDFLKLFMTPELMRWPKVQEVYGAILRATYVFCTTTNDGKRRWEDFHKRVNEHVCIIL
jgi:26S proteasome regulatory subunit N5